jgi:hypothetical protein
LFFEKNFYEFVYYLASIIFFIFSYFNPEILLSKSIEELSNKLKEIKNKNLFFGSFILLFFLGYILWLKAALG